MNIQELSADNTLEHSIESDFQKWLNAYKEFVKRRDAADAVGDNQKETAMRGYRDAAIKRLEAFLEHSNEQSGKETQIEAHLLLAELYDGKWEEQKDIRERYFYNAVELARQQWGDDFQNTPLERKIIQTSGSIINLEFYEDVKWNIGIPFMRALWSIILTKSDNRRLNQELRTKHETESIIDYLKEQSTSEEIVAKLESIFWPVQFSIVSENSGEAIMEHNVPECERRASRDMAQYPYSLTLDIFNESRTYTFAIERQDKGVTDGFTNHQLNNIINPLLRSIITNKEYVFYVNAYLYDKHLGSIEARVKSRPDINDYRAFVSEVIEKYVNPLEFHESRETDDYVEIFLKSLDICRAVTVQWRKSEKLHLSNLPQEIDAILWGEIERRVLHMAKSMLLSRSETMNGSWYPVGLNKSEIPLAGKIYSVIRAYEVLSYENNPTRVIQTMQAWWQNEYFDCGIFRILLENLDNFGGLEKVSKYPKKISTLSTRRKKHYLSYIKSLTELLTISGHIGEAYHGIRLTEDVETKKRLSLKLGKLLPILQRIADIRKIMVIARHGETESDLSDWPPGSKNELITASWRETSLKKGALLQGLLVRIFTSPLIRAHETAAIICKTIRWCIQDITPIEAGGSYILPACVSCPAVVPEKSITNPPKDKWGYRYFGLFEKLLADTNNMPWLGIFLKKSVFSPEESVNAIITHRDVARSLFIMLRNMLRNESIVAHKYEIERDGVHELFFRWGGAVLEEEAKTRGLLFSITNWKSLVQQINAISESLFGEAFHELDNRPVNLIALHDLLLDFIDRRAEESPEKLEEFIKKLRENPATKHFYDILKTEGVVE